MTSISGDADEIARALPDSFQEDSQARNSAAAALVRVFALSMVALAFLFLINTYLSIWQDWPGIPAVLGQLGWLGVDAPLKPLDSGAMVLGWVQFGFYDLGLAVVIVFVLRTRHRKLQQDADVLFGITAYLIRWAFFSVFLIGLADSVVSFMRVEGILHYVVGEGLAKDLGRSSFRGQVVHYPLMLLSLALAKYIRTLGFPWLALLIVTAEVQIVIARFVFSYEQAFMADLVRFWYGALFLFASPYTLIKEGHVRVDILYTNYSERGKAWTNTLGCTFLGLPLCWIILTLGMWGRSNVITGPLVNYEVTQAGYGLYVKYLLAALLMIFALGMLIQFMGYLMKSAAVLLRESDKDSAKA